MNISYNWLREIIDLDLSAEETAAALTRVGLAVEGIEPHGDDLVLDIDLTSNRPDCLSHLGVARELGVITGKRIKIVSSAAADPDALPDSVPFPKILAPEIVRIEAPELCPRFTARIIKNVKIGPSPEWLVKRLEAIGERSISNVADITNYVMHELGQPMHAFDLDKLSGHRIVVRTARYGEIIKTLDEVERKLEKTMLAICDADKPVAVAGIMGGFDSGITQKTVNVLLEVAYFEPSEIRRASRQLNLSTEASYRFERGVDIENLTAASDRAAELIGDLAGGDVSELIDTYPSRPSYQNVDSPDISAAVLRLTGLKVANAECVRILQALGVQKLSETTYGSPSWRRDIAIEEDLVEEIARHAGYENIREELPPAYGAGEYQPTESRKRSLRDLMTGRGFDEALSYSFIDTKFDGLYETVPELVETADNGAEFVTLRDSVIDGSVRMRPTLLPGLLESIRLNFNHNRRDICLFEIGKVFAARPGEGELPSERELFAFALTGNETREGRSAPGRELDFYDAKGFVEAVAEAVNAYDIAFSAGDIEHLQKGQSAVVAVNGRTVGTLGRLNSEIAASYKFKQPVYVAEIDLQTVLSDPTQPILYKALPKYPSVVRDVSFLVKNNEVTFAEIKNAITAQGVDICEKVDFVDIYEGKGMADGERSLTIRIEYRDAARTLTEEEVAGRHAVVVADLESVLGIKPRI